jgi:hypothetical protein
MSSVEDCCPNWSEESHSSYMRKGREKKFQKAGHGLVLIQITFIRSSASFIPLNQP